VRKVHRGCGEHEILVSDTQSGLYSVDSRTGNILTGYKGISGAVTSMACVASSHFASVSLDRFIRLHVAYPLPPGPKDRPAFEKRGDNEKTPLKFFLKSAPTAIEWDGMLNDPQGSSSTAKHITSDYREADDDDWDEMNIVVDKSDVSESDAEEERSAVRPRRR